MHCTITAIYTALTAFLFIVLAYRVVQFRQKFNAGIGDKGDRAFNVAIRTHANLVENAPITLLLMLLAENLGAWPWFLHLSGIIFVVSRIAHAWGMTKALGNYSKYRFFGVVGSWLVLLALALFDLVAALIR
ncbi:MAG: MAPEG family protein [Hahellaceae bacterium]|nr:MAPEG family protein [Hahellaceae bacterium]MCP5168292.1 MAPEG family protein [Hahellaceae bacterium]